MDLTKTKGLNDSVIKQKALMRQVIIKNEYDYSYNLFIIYNIFILQHDRVTDCPISE